tara:strand:+ start:1183 stop:1725 length:543 start_codon:yes stop_codon:yes gene_type:complete
MKLNKEDILEIFENAISWIVVLAMYIYGGAKFLQFRGAATTNKIVSEMSGFEIMWAFYGYSKPFAITLGIFEIIGGTLILIKRTRVMGCIFTSTILINVILQDFFYDIPAIRAAILYQFLLLIILWLNKEKIIETIKILTKKTCENSTKYKTFLKLGLAFITFIFFRVLEYYITIKFKGF